MDEPCVCCDGTEAKVGIVLRVEGRRVCGWRCAAEQTIDPARAWHG